jgi:hypothetical protein
MKSAKPLRPTKAQKASLKRIEREEEILAKSPDQLTPAEWKWLSELMGKIVKRESRGRKKKERYEDWMHAYARAQLLRKTPPRIADLAGLRKPVRKDYPAEFEYLMAKDDFEAKLTRERDAFKKSRRQRRLPRPPKRSPI